MALNRPVLRLLHYGFEHSGTLNDLHKPQRQQSIAKKNSRYQLPLQQNWAVSDD